MINSDVVEHVFSPFEKSIKGSFLVLKPGGWMILTTPYSSSLPFIDHYPQMSEYKVIDGGKRILSLNKDGSKQIIDNPVFHGGPGKTLEMRFFNKWTLVDSLIQVGFTNIKVQESNIKKFGINRSALGMGALIAQRPA